MTSDRDMAKIAVAGPVTSPPQNTLCIPGKVKALAALKLAGPNHCTERSHNSIRD